MSQTPPNDKPMNEDEAWVSAQYQKAMREQDENDQKASPSSAIDDAILAKAKQAIMQASIQADHTQQENKKRSQPWLRWQYGGSVAASVVILVFIYIGNQENVLEQTTFSAPEKSIPASPSSFMDTQEELAAPAGIQAVEAPVERKLSLAMQAKAVFTQMQSIREADEAEARSAMAMQSRMKQESQVMRVQKEKAKVTESEESKDTATSQDADTYSSLQVKLFKLLQKQKLAEQDWRLPEQYKAVLTEKQIETLLAEE
jgi:hypothetical protein